MPTRRTKGTERKKSVRTRRTRVTKPSPMGKMGKSAKQKGRSRGTTKRGTQSTPAIRKSRKRAREMTATGPRIIY